MGQGKNSIQLYPTRVKDIAVIGQDKLGTLSSK